MNESDLLEWIMGRFPARTGWVRIKRNQVKIEAGRAKRNTTESATFPNAKKKKRRFSDSTRSRGAPAAPPSSPFLDPLQIGGGIMTCKIIRSWDLDRDLENTGLNMCL